MAGISKKTYKGKDGDLITKYTITYRDIYNKQHTSGMYDSEREAAKDLYKFDSRKKSNSKNVTMGDVLNTFMEKVNKKYAKSTRERYQDIITKYLKNFLDVKYSKLRPLIFQEFLDDIEAKTPFVADDILKFCKAAANYCKTPKIKLVSNNIFDEIEPVKLPKSKKQNLTLNETFALLKECAKSDNWFFPILFCFVMNGLREGELFALNKEDFNFTHNNIWINKQYTSSEFKEKTKTDKSNRFVIMLPVFILFMEIYLPLVPKNTKLVFPNANGSFINPSNLRERHWKKLLERCGYERNYTSIHKLRAFYIDLMFYLGVQGKFTQSQVGHVNYKTTYNSYASNNSSIRDAAIAKISEGMGFDSPENTMDKDTIKESFREMLILYVKNNPKIIDKAKELNKISEFFGEIKKCEKNVRIFEQKNNPKIIQFPKLFQEL